MKRFAVLMLAVPVAVAALGGCAVGLLVPGPPPGPLVDVRAAAPGPGFVWIDGYWSWRSRWVWLPGSWVVPPRARAVWIPGRWHRHAGGWRWTAGFWR